MLDPAHFLIRSLVDAGDVSEGDLARAAEYATSRGVDRLEGLIGTGAISSQRVAIARAKLCEYSFIDLPRFDIDINNAELMPRSVAEGIVAFPLFMIDGTATVGMVDPLDLQNIDRIRRILKCDVDPVVCDPEQLKALISRAYSIAGTHGYAGGESGENDDLTTGDEPIVAAVNQILAAAIRVGASDVHINPDEHDLHLRYRVDGVLAPQQAPAHSAHAGIVQRLKVMARLDLTQTRRPQDGKFRFTDGEARVDVRLSLIPTIHGENVVMRLLRSASAIGSIDDLQMPTEMGRAFAELIDKPHGMILVTGPTGSGKTTTLYTGLSRLNSPERNVMTIEDPVEIRLPLIRQVQVNADVGLTFASALRSILRQDPDVVLVGEIRDEETARIAVQAAMTGHLVFSTLHTNDAIGAIARLRDFGLPPFAINSALLAVVAQRLVRQVCPQCTRQDHVAAQRLAAVGLGPEDGNRFFRGPGCPKCGNSGYRGRVGVFEMLTMSPGVYRGVEAAATSAALREVATADGFRSMWYDGLAKAFAGITSFEEVSRLHRSFDDQTEAETPAREAA